MFETSRLGQGITRSPVVETRRALVTLDHHLERLHATRVLDVTALAPAYLALPPRGHALATSHRVDVGFVGRALALLGDPSALAATRFVVSTVQASTLPVARSDGPVVELTLEASDHAAADALALALGLVVEREKARPLLGELPGASLAVAARLLAVDEGELVSAFGTPERAIVALRALASTTAPTSLHLVDRARDDDGSSGDDDVVGAGPLFIVAGATERVRDMLSPFVRRLDARLAALAGAPDDDALYAALPLVMTEDPLVERERRLVETRDGIAPRGDVLIARPSRLGQALVDPRARALVAELASRDATIVIAPRSRAALVDAILRYGPSARAIIAIGEGFVPASTVFFPDVVASGYGMHALENPLTSASDDAPVRVAYGVPGLGLAPLVAPDVTEGAVSATLVAKLIDVVVMMRAGGALPRACRTAAAVVTPGDDVGHSTLALLCLEKMARTSGVRARP